MTLKDQTSPFVSLSTLPISFSTTESPTEVANSSSVTGPIELAITILKPITTLETDELWHPIVFNENSSRYFDTIESLLTFDADNASGNISYRDNRTILVNNATVQLVSMILTAIMLGFIILSTIIGN
ncbi:unnamed protein product [Diabrotica balteata]|uniref:Uncharacterized protein n=1 Tax=Diabrotica balteata TaxID=107213 RepID=A0A9N9XFW9_DIABA|nr:unnamed protein product [Diabrotica balteata]